MPSRALPSLRWTTASFSAPGGTGATDLSGLVAHFRDCTGCQGRWFKIACAIETLNGFVASRFVTTVMLVGAVTALGALAL